MPDQEQYDRMVKALETIAFEAGMSADPDGGPWYKQRLVWCEATASNALPPTSWLSTADRPRDPWRLYANELHDTLDEQVNGRIDSVKKIVHA